MANVLHAEDDLASGRFVVSFSPAESQSPWIAKALELNVYNDLAGYARIAPVSKKVEAEQQCGRSNIDCILDLYQELNVDALMIGRVNQTRIEFEVFDVQKKSLVNTGAISISRGSTLLQLRMDAFNAFKPFLATGGILERRQFASQSEVETAFQLAEAQDVSNGQMSKPLLIFLALLICFPYLFSMFGKPRTHSERTSICLRWFFPFIFVSGLGLGFLYILDSTAYLNINFVNFYKEYHWGLVAIGGLVWGYFLIVNLNLIHPHFQGLERIDQKTLLPLIESYLLTFLVKCCFLLAIYTGVFYGAYHVAHRFSVPQPMVTLLLLPLSGLFVLCWYGLVLEVMAMSLDGRLSKRGDDYVDVWDAKLRKYFISYVKRNGVVLNEKLLDKVIFLVGDDHSATKNGVVCYGGLFSRPRIVVDYELIRYALGDNNPVIQEFNRPRAWQSKLSLFLPQIFPRILGKKKRIRKKKMLTLLAHLQANSLYDLNHHSSTLKIGQDKIMKGIILPRFEGKEDLPSLMSDNLEDMSILEALMQEDTIKSDPFDEEAEIDDSSAKDKDFLFGMLLHKFGELLRYDHLFSTFYMYFFKKRFAKDIPYHFPFAEYFSKVADTFVVMNSGLNHLLQYLYYRAANVTFPITTKGSPDELLESQNLILQDVVRLTKDRKITSSRYDRFARIMWLTNFCKETVVTNQDIRVRKPLLWLFSLTLMFLITTVFLRSYNYHPRYEAIIATEKQEIAEMIKSAQEQERKEQ